MPSGGLARKRRRLIVGVLATGAVPAVIYIGITGMGGNVSSNTLGSAPPATATNEPSGNPRAEQSPTASPTAGLAERAQGEALATLEALAVKGRAPKTGYERALFGLAWTDVDGNGCNTRDDILLRDLTDARVGDDGCTVQTGLLAGPYSGRWIPFVRGEDSSALVHIDHVVALSDAWQKGEQQLSADERERFANDPLNLLAVDGGLNQQKGDGDAATWLPPNRSFWCHYVARQVAVKARYTLWLSTAERDAIIRVLSRCPGQALPSHADAPDVTPTGTPPATGAIGPETQHDAGTGLGERASASDSQHLGAFADCSEAREAGAAPVRDGDPGYGRHLDGDGDGVACN